MTQPSLTTEQITKASAYLVETRDALIEYRIAPDTPRRFRELKAEPDFLQASSAAATLQ